MPPHYERRHILATNNEYVYKLDKHIWNDLNRKFYQKMWPRLIQRRNKIENFKRSRQLNRGNMFRNVKPRLTQYQSRVFDDRRFQSSSFSNKTRDRKSSTSFHENDASLNTNFNRRLNIKLPYFKFRQVRNENDKIFKSTVTSKSFGSAFVKISIPFAQSSVPIRIEPSKYTPQSLEFKRTELLQNYRFLDHFVVFNKF